MPSRVLSPKRAYVIAIAIALVATCGCGNPDTATDSASAESGRIVVLMNGNSPFWDTMRAGINAASEEFGVEASLETNDGTPRGQIDKLRQFASQGDIAAVAIAVTDAANPAIADEMKNLQDRGIKVITVDSDVDREKFRDVRFAFVGTDNLAGGRELGVCAKNLRPEGGEYVTFVGRTGAQNAIERIDGFGEGAGDEFVDRDKMGDENDRTKARENVRNAIRNHENLDTLVGIWSYNAPAIVDVVRELDVRDRFTIVTFDAEPVAIQNMAEGDIDAMVVQNPFEMGYQGVRLMKALIEDDRATIAEILPNHGQPDGDIYDTGLKVVVPDADTPLVAEMFGDTTEFLSLSEFRKWLDQYELKGS